MSKQVVYDAEPTASKFHLDQDSQVKALMSAVGCGKSVACVMELIRLAQNQAPDAAGVRYSRWAIIRSSYSQLRSTTIKTFQEWVPPSICRIVYTSPIRGELKMTLPDGTTVNAELLFMSLDGPDQIANLLSLELTGAWINEAAEIRNENILNDVFQRTGRYPAKHTAPLTWTGVIMDYNPPPIGSWLHKHFEIDKPAKHTLYRIPSPVKIIRDELDPEDPKKMRFVASEDAENVKNHQKGIDYWVDIAEANRHNHDYITRFVLGDYPYGIQGSPVFPQFSVRRHVSEDMSPDRSSYLIVGLDLGLCYADDTEVLTSDGFKYFKDVTMEDTFATRNPENGVIEYHKPNFLVDEPHDGDMIEWDNQSISLLVTPEHQVPMTFRDTPDKVHFKSAEWIEQRPGGHHFVDLTAKWEGQEPADIMGYDPEWFAWFMGIFLTDGNISKTGDSYRITLAQTKPAGRLEIEKHLDSSWNPAPDRYRKTDNLLGKYLYELGATKPERSIPPEILELSPRLLKIFIDGFTLGDGHIRTRENGAVEHTACTAHEHIAKQLQEVALKIGWNASCNIQKTAGNVREIDGREVVTNVDMFSIAFKKRAKRAELQQANPRRVHYKGRRYCVNVPHHVLYVRRKGKCSWNGNTPAACVSQYIDGKVCIFNELTSTDSSLEEFLEDDLLPLLRSKYPNYKTLVAGDPAGVGRSSIDKTTPFQTMKRYGLKYYIPKTNSFHARREAVNWLLRREPGLRVHPDCIETIKGFSGGYRWKEVRGQTGGVRTTAEKNHSSHLLDSIQYACMYFRSGSAVFTDDFSARMYDERPQNGRRTRQGEDFLFA